MTRPPLPRIAWWVIDRVVPADWCEAVAGDLHEERNRRRASGRYAGTLWLVSAAFITGIRLTHSRRSDCASQQTKSVNQERSHMERLRSDFHHAIRGLRAHRTYAIAAIVTLALGLGANAAVFNLANWLLLRPLPGVRDEGRLVTVMFGSPDGTRLGTSVPDAQALASGSPGLVDLAGFLTTPAHIAVNGGAARRIAADVVGGHYFNVLGLLMTQGRGFTDQEGSEAGGNPVAVISHRVWRQDFGSASDIVGRTMVVNRQTVTVIGVAARGFHGASLSGESDLWMPISQLRVIAPQYSATATTNRRIGVFAGLIGRLADGASIDAVAAQTEAARVALAAANPADARMRRWRYIVTPGAEAFPWERTELSRTFTMLGGIVGLLLVLTAANVGNLMVGRASSRRDEIATRLALGASKWAIARLLLAESVLLSAVAGAAAVGLAWLVGTLLEGTVILQGLPPLERATIDWRVLGAAVGLSTAVALIAGVYPAFAAGRLDAGEALRPAGRSHTVNRQRVRRVLTTAQVAVSVALLIAAALFVRSMSKRLSIDPGFDTSRVLTLSVAPGLQDYGDRQPTFYGDLVDRVRQVPGVRAAAVSWLRPSFQRVGSDTLFHPEGAAADVRIDTDTNTVSAGFFEAIGLPVAEGREFSDAEFRLPANGGADVAIMTASLAKRAFGGAPAIGRMITVTGEKTPRIVVGVVRDTRQRGLTKPSTDMLFLPFSASSKYGWASVIVGLSAPDREVIPRLRAAVAELDPTLPTYDVMRVDESIRTEFATSALVMRLTTVFAVLATLVAAVGLYGVLARAVAERGREFGIRVALGASPAAVGRLVARESTVVLIAGVLIGGAISAWLVRFAQAYLFGVDRLDVISYASAVAIITVVMGVAMAPASRRAAKADPVAILRS